MQAGPACTLEGGALGDLENTNLLQGFQTCRDHIEVGACVRLREQS